VLVFAGNMSNMRPEMRSLLVKASKKVTGQDTRDRSWGACRERTAEVLFPVRVTDDPVEEEEVPLKRKRLASSDKGKEVQTAPSRTPIGDGELIELPNVCSKPDMFGPQSTLFLSDRELKVIDDLGVAGRSQAMTEGIIGAMRALEIVVVLNYSSTEAMIHADALAKERDEAMAKKERLDKKLDDMKAELATVKKRSAEDRRILAQVKEARMKLAEGKLRLEASLRDATGPSPNEPEDLRGLSHYGLVDKIVEMEKSLVGSVRQSFENAIDQMKIANPGFDLSTEGMHFLNFVQGGMIVAPSDDDDVPAHTTL